MIELFADTDRGGFFTTAHDHEELVVRRKDVDDHPIPSGNSAAAFGLLRLAALTGEHDYERHAAGVFRLLHQAAASHPQALAHLLTAMDFHFAPVKEVALVGEPSGDGLGELATVVRSGFRPHVVLAGGPEGSERTGADAGANRGRRPARRVRVRALRLPPAGHRARGALSRSRRRRVIASAR